MEGWRLPRVFWLYVLLSVLQPVLFVWVGAIQHLNTRGIWFVVLLLVGLAYGSRVTWLLLLLVNGVPLVFMLPILGAGVIWSHVMVAALTGMALVWMLLSRPMREHVGRRRHAVSPQP